MELDSEGEPTSHLYDVEWVDKIQTWVATGEGGLVVKSDASGETWNAELVSPGKSPWFIDLEPHEEDLYITGEDNGVLTVNSGEWIELPRTSQN